MNLLELVDAAMAELEPARVQPSRNDDPLDEIAAVFSEFDPAIILPKQSVNEAAWWKPRQTRRRARMRYPVGSTSVP